MKYFNLRAMSFVLSLAMAFSVMSCDDDDESKDDKGGAGDGLEWVDLGLPSGTLWAPCNLGAESPEELGIYVSWGKMKVEFDNDYDLDVDDDELKAVGVIDKNGNLTASYDVATQKYGGHIPTLSQWEELYDECMWSWTTLNGVRGYKVVGYKGSIFLPAAGVRHGKDPYDEGSYGYYWSSTPYPGYADGAYALGFGSDDVYPYSNAYRCDGFPVRPVSEKVR